MGLKYRKFINNTKTLPGFESGLNALALRRSPGVPVISGSGYSTVTGGINAGLRQPHSTYTASPSIAQPNAITNSNIPLWNAYTPNNNVNNQPANVGNIPNTTITPNFSLLTYGNDYGNWGDYKSPQFNFTNTSNEPLTRDDYLDYMTRTSPSGSSLVLKDIPPSTIVPRQEPYNITSAAALDLIKVRTPGTQNVAPKISNKPITKDGITDVSPNGTTGDDIGKKSNKIALNNQYGSMISTGTDGILKGLDNMSYKSSDDLVSEAGYNEQSVHGRSYRTVGDIQGSDALKEQRNKHIRNTIGMTGTGAAVGAMAGGPLGAVIGGAAGLLAGLGTSIFGRIRQKKAIARAKREKLSKNSASYSSAMTDYLQEKEALEASEANNSYADGKMPLIDTAYGVSKGVPNSKTSKGEIIGDIRDMSTLHEVKRGPNDTALSYVDPEYGFVLSKKNGAVDALKRTGDINYALEVNRSGGAKYSNGKLPRLKEGWIPSAAIGTLGMLGGLYQYFDAKDLEIKNANTYASNPYARSALRGLAGLQYNPYPILNQLTNRQAYLNYALNNSGGLSGALRYLGRIANANNMYKTTADLLSNLQERNIGLRSNYYNTMANIGAQDAQRRQSANQYDLDYYSKAHAARLQGMQMGLYNMLSAAQNWYANDFKRRQFNESMAAYKDDLELEWEKLKRKTR